jgi:hypothetical protein
MKDYNIIFCIITKLHQFLLKNKLLDKYLNKSNFNIESLDRKACYLSFFCSFFIINIKKIIF